MEMSLSPFILQKGRNNFRLAVFKQHGNRTKILFLNQYSFLRDASLTANQKQTSYLNENEFHLILSGLEIILGWTNCVYFSFNV